MSEKSDVINFEKGIGLKEKKEQQDVEKIKKGIVELRKGKERYDEWRVIALEQGDEKSALFYETKIFEIEMLISDGEMLCDDCEIAQLKRWQDHFKHVMEIENKSEAEERLENIDAELEFISAYLECLLEDSENADENKKQKIQEMQKRKEELENERLKYPEK